MISSRWTLSFLAAVAVALPASAADTGGVDSNGDPITYSKQIARIVQENCQECHRPEAVAPFSLLNFRQVRGWAKMIKEVVNDGRMPPWYADPHVGEFSNDARLSGEEKRQLNWWLDHGMPRGDEADLPEPTEWVDGWFIGKPDIIFEMPEEATIDPTGVVPYQYFTTPTNFEEDVWVEAVECRPGNSKVLHHIIMFIQDPNDSANGNRDGVNNFLDSYAPGSRPFMMGNGLARRIPKGANLVWQVHYTPTGKTEHDRSRFGIRLHRGEVKRQLQTVLAANTDFVIPPGAANYKVTGDMRFPEAATIYSFTPHMHYRGKSMSFTVVYPDGREVLACSVPNYDFNWQLDYRLKEPLKVPAGTNVHVEAYFDNSEDNPYNPDPTKAVKWGEQTWEEMMLAGAFVSWDKQPNLPDSNTD